jgi:hypothetical protein
MDGMSAPNPSGIRIGNDERAAAMQALDEHMTAGRLDPEEYGQRVAQASVARTREGLEELFVDLPAPHPFPANPTYSADGRAGRRRPTVIAERAMSRYTGESTIVRLAVLVLAVVVFLVALPFLLAGAVLVFVVLPMLTHRGWGGRARYGRPWRW